MLYESLVGHCEYTTQPKGSFWCHGFDTKGAISFLLTYVRVKAVGEAQE